MISNKFLFAKRFSAGNHEYHIVSHQSENYIQITTFAGIEPIVNQSSNRTFVFADNVSGLLRLHKASP
jgi:hypothetical protein